MGTWFMGFIGPLRELFTTQITPLYNTIIDKFISSAISSYDYALYMSVYTACWSLFYIVSIVCCVLLFLACIKFLATIISGFTGWMRFR